MQLSGLQGSVLEHRIFEDDLQVDSISTAKLFQIANNRQIPILAIDKTNIGTISLPFDAGIVEDITNAVNQDLLAKIPNQEMTYQDWTGIGYTKEDIQTNESGYLLSGMIAGGMTAVSPNKWLRQDMVDILGRPYAGDFKLFEITYPANESIVFVSPVSVRGIVLDSKAKVLVNGIEAQVEGTTFTANGINLNRGANKIIATATNKAGITLTDSVTVKYKILLRTYFTFPYDAANLSVSPIDIEGVVSDPLATINVNGISAVVSPDGRFIARGITLSEGANQITTTATNPEGDTDTQTITVNYQPNPLASLQITITSPTDNETINRPSVLVKGTVTTDAEEVWIKVNGVLAEVYNGQFVANHVPLTEGDNKIIANATDSNGAIGRAEVSVKANTTVPYITLNANITSGISPLNSYFTVTTEMPNAVTSYQMDFEGDGTIDYTGPTFENISHTYTTEGIYYPTVTVTDDKGNTYTDVIGIVVVNKTQLESIFKRKWDGMKAVLLAGNIETALNYFVEPSKDMFRNVFVQMGSDKTNSRFSSIFELRLDILYGRLSECGALRNESGVVYSYPVTFIKDGDGIWKIMGF